jgi:hypothetical protein
MKLFWSAFAKIALGFLILIQRDVDHTLLVNGWMGLLIVCLILHIWAIVELTIALTSHPKHRPTKWPPSNRELSQSKDFNKLFGE